MALKHGAIFAGGIFALVLVLLALSAVTATFLNQSWIIFSASTSPDGKFIAENSMTGDEDAIDRIRVRGLNGPVAYEAIFQGTMPSIFLNWLDNTHLVVLSDEREKLPRPTIRIENDEAVQVSYSDYVRLGAADASLNARNHLALTLNASDISGKFLEGSRSLPSSKSCALDLSARDGNEYATIGMNIIVGEYPCGPPQLRGKTCGGIQSRFNVGQLIQAPASRLLTSATVSEIPSYNELPDGSEYRAIRGQFLGHSSSLLIGALEKPLFSVDYNFGFDKLNIRYTIPTSAISATLAEFRQCVGQDVFYP